MWFDAHGDFNTPETSPGGFVDGMPLAMATGRCYPQVWQRLGEEPAAVPEAHVLHVGSRDFDPGEQQSLADSGVEVVSGEDIVRRGVRAALVPALDTLRGHVEAVYLHIDIDVLDPAAAPAVDFPSTGGLTVPELEEAIWLVAGHLSVRAAALTAYDRSATTRTRARCRSACTCSRCSPTRSPTDTARRRSAASARSV